MNTKHIQRALLPGLLATAVMTMVMFAGPMMGFPEMNVPAMLAGFMGIPIAFGWIAHFMIGSILAVAYAVRFSRILPGQYWMRGAIYSLLPWFTAQVAVNPMMGAGVFATNTPMPLMIVMGSLIGHLVYGLVLGALYRPHEFKVSLASNM